MKGRREWKIEKAWSLKLYLSPIQTTFADLINDIGGTSATILTGNFVLVIAIIDPYHAAAILDLKRGWTGTKNTHAIFRMHNLF